jgi:hypothetical protein
MLQTYVRRLALGTSLQCHRVDFTAYPLSLPVLATQDIRSGNWPVLHDGACFLGAQFDGRTKGTRSSGKHLFLLPADGLCWLLGLSVLEQT